MDYADWIAAYRARTGSTINKCLSAVQEMVLAFPELRPVRGFVRFVADEDWTDAIDWRSVEMHWWCKTPDEEIVDPTEDQYGGEPFTYVPYDETKHGPLPTGKCMNCGELLFHGHRFCNDACESEVLGDLIYGG